MSAPWRRLAWFVGLWVAGVLVLAIVTVLLRFAVAVTTT